ncbi:hypothetical protein ACRRTK_010374 [Alexandromys fortis]
MAVRGGAFLVGIRGNEPSQRCSMVLKDSAKSERSWLFLCCHIGVSSEGAFVTLFIV